jgi:hypothetical protein
VPAQPGSVASLEWLRKVSVVGSIEHGWKLVENFTSDRAQLAHAIDTLGVVRGGVRAKDPLAFAFVPPGESDLSDFDEDVQAVMQKELDRREHGRMARALLLSFRPDGLETGHYSLSVRISDRASGKTAIASTELEIQSR